MAQKKFQYRLQKVLDFRIRKVETLQAELALAIRDRDTEVAMLNALSEKVAHKMAVADQMVFRHFQEIRAICTPKQQVKFDEIIKDALHQQGRGQMRNGPLNGRRAGPPPPQ